MDPEITTKICDSTSIVAVIIHTNYPYQIHWIFEIEVRWVGHFALPNFSMNRVTNYPNTNKVKTLRSRKNE